MATTEHEILTRFAAIVAAYTGAPAGEVVPEADLADDLDIDSLAIVEVLFDVENQFKVTVPSESVGRHASLKTIGDLVDYIDRLVAEQHPVAAEIKAAN